MKKLAIWDADNLPYIVCWNKKDSETIKTFEDCCNHADSIIKDILFKTGVKEFILYFTRTKCFRYKIYPEYKANRKGLEKPLYFHEVTDYLINKYEGVFHPDLEGDDLCVIHHRDNPDSIIITVDKDILCCVAGTFYNPSKDEWKTVNKEEAELGLWTSMLVGDKTDNIFGVNGIGPVKAKKILLDGNLNNYSEIVYKTYIDLYGIDKGINNFYMNYKCLKIVEYYDNFVIPEPIPAPKFELQLPEFPQLDLNFNI